MLDGKVVRETCLNSTVDYFYDNDGRPYRFTVKVGANDPAISKFINADSGISGNGEELLGYNMYTDCFNNPINLDDSEGNWPIFRNIVKAVKVIVYVEYPRVESWNDSATSAFIDFKTEKRPIIVMGSKILEIWGMR